RRSHPPLSLSRILWNQRLNTLSNSGGDVTKTYLSPQHRHRYYLPLSVLCRSEETEEKKPFPISDDGGGQTVHSEGDESVAKPEVRDGDAAAAKRQRRIDKQGDGRILVVPRRPEGILSELLEDVVDEGGLGGDSDVGVNLLQNLEDVDIVGLLLLGLGLLL
ncbi:hypothetical protein LINPERPRIM_LOCUS23999, partial [Linum perenne]